MVAYELIDPTAAKIVLAADRDDSINQIANKIGNSYSWTYEWIERLADENIIAKTDTGIRVVDHEMRQCYEDIMGAVTRRSHVSPDEAYTIPQFAGMEFAFTEIDAAFVWTHGGYQIARDTEDYPIFLRVHDRDVERWEVFLNRFGFETAIAERPPASDVDGSIYYVLYPVDSGFDIEWVDGRPVIPVENAVEQMRENRPAYEPALEMVANEYGVDIKTNHHDANTS